MPDSKPLEVDLELEAFADGVAVFGAVVPDVGRIALELRGKAWVLAGSGRAVRVVIGAVQ